MHQQQITDDPALLEPLLFGMEGDRCPIGIPCGLQDDGRGRAISTQDDGEGIEWVDTRRPACGAHFARESFRAAQHLAIRSTPREKEGEGADRRAALTTTKQGILSVLAADAVANRTCMSRASQR